MNHIIVKHLVTNDNGCNFFIVYDTIFNIQIKPKTMMPSKSLQNYNLN